MEDGFMIDSRVIQVGLTFCAAVLLFFRAYEAKRDNAEILKGDFGIQWFGVGWLMWFLIALVKISTDSPADAEIRFLIVALSTANNLCFLLGYEYLEHAPQTITIWKRDIPLARDNWKIIVATTCFIALLLEVGLFTLPSENKENWISLVDLSLSLIMFYLIGMGLWNTYRVRRRFLWAYLSLFAIGALFFFQFIAVPGVTEFFKTHFGLGDYITQTRPYWSNLQVFLFFVSLLPLVETWVEEVKHLPEPSKMSLDFIGQIEENGKYRIAILLDSSSKKINVDLSYSPFLVLLQLAVFSFQQIDKGDDTLGVNLGKDQEEALRRALRDIAKAKKFANVNLGDADEDYLQKIEATPRWEKDFDLLSGALRPQLIRRNKGRNGHSYIRIPEHRINLDTSEQTVLSSMERYAESCNNRLDRIRATQIIEVLKAFHQPS